MICNKCHIDKAEDQFYKDKSHTDKIRRICKTCDKKSAKERYFKNRELRIQQRAIWGRKNRSYESLQDAVFFKGIGGGKSSLPSEDLKMIAVERLAKLKIAKRIDSNSAFKIYKKLMKSNTTESKEIINNIFNHKLLGVKS